MTDTEKKDIARLRAQGVGYGTIAARLDLSENTVKSFCRRNKLQSNIEHGIQTQRAVCLHCGNDIAKAIQRNNRKFCSAPCRRAWWKTHDKQLDRRAYYSIVCACCGTTFQSYGNKNRKYCGHPCYIKARFEQEAKTVDTGAI